MLAAAAGYPQTANDTIPGTAGIHLGEPDVHTIYSSRGSVLTIAVFKDGKHPLDRQAVIGLKRPNDVKGYWQATDDRAQSIFIDLLPGTYEIEIAAVGYLTDRQEFVIHSGANSQHLEVTLRPDPSSVDLNAPLGSSMSAKARKATERAVTALKSGNYKEAQKFLQKAYKLDPASSDINCLLGYLSMQQGERERAVGYLETAVVGDPRNTRALTLLGRLRLQQKDYGKAAVTLEQAVASDNKYWLAQHLLAQAYLEQHEYAKAEQHARLALADSQGASKSPLLVLGQALSQLGRDPEAIQALKDYLPSAPKDPSTQLVAAFVGELEKRVSHPASVALPVSLPPLEMPGTEETDELRLSIQTWRPPGVDEEKPEVAAGVTCPADAVLEQAGARVRQLVESVSKFAAVEQLQHETVDELGHALTRDIRQYNYLVDISEPSPGVLSVSEFRMVESRMAEFPGQMMTQGLPAMALVFHPDIRGTFQFDCEGLGQWHGEAAWLVHFRQRADQPNRIRSYRIGGNVYAVDLKGRAWISAQTLQILRVESDLVRPLPNIQLLTEHQTVEYGPVAFPEKHTQLWLPKSVELYADFHRQRYVRRHSFDHFMLFSVDTIEKPGTPHGGAAAPPPPSPSGT